MNIRRLGFFMLDRHQLMAKQLEEIKKANENDDFARELHHKCIANLINHINATVPFYQKLNISRFEDLPVVNKVMMRETPQLFKSTADLKVGKVRHTSGSTGIPFEIVQDIRKSKRIQAEVIYYREIVGDQLGTKYINLVTPSRLEKVSKLSEIMQNAVLFDVTKMDEETMERLHYILAHHHNIYYMLGYASALEKIANYFFDKGYIGGFSLNAIVSSSEILTDNCMHKLNTIFKCPIYDRYSNEDNGFLAQTDGKSREFLVNRGSYYIEILKLDSDEPTEENEIGRIVVTDYYNYLQPFVRYDTGDLAAYSYKKYNGANRYVLTKLAGRMSDMIYDVNDNLISTFAIGTALMTFKIQQYQLVQNSKYDIVLNVIDPLKRYTDVDYQKVLESLLGRGIRVSINYMDTIPVLNSGKFKRVICNYKPEKGK